MIPFEIEFEALQREVHANAVAKGFHSNGQHPATGIALIHSELSELLEVYRDEEEFANSSKLDGVTKAEAELADVVIRCMDFAAEHGLDLAQAIVRKHQFNLLRPAKHGGKSF